LVNITEDYGTDMTELNREEIEAVVAEELEFLLRWESNLPEPSQDMELIKATMRVLQEFKVFKKDDK
jgi:hypothetical protein